MAGVIIGTIIVLALLVLTVAGIWKTFTKAGESGWKAIIPIYNIYIAIKISGHSGWWLLIFFLPAVIALAGGQVVNEIYLISPQETAKMSFLFSAFLVSWHFLWIVSAVITYNLSRSFGKGIGFTVGLSLLGFIFWPILGFGEAEYYGPAAKEAVNEGSSYNSRAPTPEQPRDSQ